MFYLEKEKSLRTKKNLQIIMLIVCFVIIIKTLFRKKGRENQYKENLGLIFEKNYK